MITADLGTGLPVCMRGCGAVAFLVVGTAGRPSPSGRRRHWRCGIGDWELGKKEGKHVDAPDVISMCEAKRRWCAGVPADLLALLRNTCIASRELLRPPKKKRDQKKKQRHG